VQFYGSIYVNVSLDEGFFHSLSLVF